MALPEVSIIVPCYNGANYISLCLTSILNQDLKDWEIIIVDDLSSDNSIAVIRSFIDHHSISKQVQVIQNQTRCGPAISRNNAIRLAKGRFIAFLDCDDLWLPNRLSSQLPLFDNPEVKVVCGGYNIIDDQGNLTGQKLIPPSTTDYRNMLAMNTVGCLTAMYDTKRSGKVYMPTIPRRQDYGLWLKLIRSGGIIAGYQDIIASYRSHSGTISSNKLAVTYWQWYLYRKHEKLSIVKSLRCLSNHLLGKHRKYGG